MSHADAGLAAHLRSFAGSEGMGSLRGQLLIITAMLVVAALILMGTTLTSLQSSLLESEAAERTILEITTVESRLIDLNGALASYVLTDDRWFQKRLDKSNAEMEIAMRKLRHSLQNDPVQLKNYGEMAPLLERQADLVKYLRAPEHRSDASRPDMVRKATVAADIIRSKLWVILQAERAKRLVHHARMMGEARKSFWLSVGIVTFTFLIGVSFFWLSNSGRRNNRAAVR